MRQEKLAEMKKEDFYQQFLSATGGKPVAEIKEPDLSADVTSGTWEDLLIKWKVQIQVWLKTKDNSKSSNPTLPLNLLDSNTKANVVEKQGKDFVLLKIQNPPSYAFLHYSRYELNEMCLWLCLIDQVFQVKLFSLSIYLFRKY